MAREIVDIALVEIDVPQGPNLELNEMSELTIGDTDPGAAPVKAMRRARRSIGFKRGVPEFEIGLEIMPVNPPEVDYRALKAAGTIFQIYYEENDGGQRFQIQDCLVSSVEKTRNAEGEATNSVTILALDHFLEP